MPGEVERGARRRVHSSVALAWVVAEVVGVVVVYWTCLAVDRSTDTGAAAWTIHCMIQAGGCNSRGMHVHESPRNV